MADARKVRSKSIGHYVLMKTIGEGTFGKVKLGTHILTGERVAVKVLEKERIVDIADVERVAREIHILKLIRHPHIIQLYEIIETPKQLYLIMEYAPGGELFDYIVQHTRAEEPEACRFLHQILAGVEQVHAMNVVHRDLKPENLLLDEVKGIKIVDFGLSNTYQDDQLLQTACGSPCYAAPEMIAGQRYVPARVDIWSCGVILFALVCGYLPFEAPEDQNHSELYRKILNAEYEMPNFVSEDVADLISSMLTTDPEKRLTLDGIRQHRWYRQIPEASIQECQDATASGRLLVLDQEILDQLESYGFPREYSVKCLQSNKHNHATTTYYLLRTKKQLQKASQGAKNAAADIRIADMEATGYDEDEAEAAPLASAIAALPTPSRGQRGEVELVNGGSARRHWIPQPGDGGAIDGVESGLGTAMSSGPRLGYDGQDEAPHLHPRQREFDELTGHGGPHGLPMTARGVRPRGYLAAAEEAAAAASRAARSCSPRGGAYYGGSARDHPAVSSRRSTGTPRVRPQSARGYGPPSARRRSAGGAEAYGAYARRPASPAGHAFGGLDEQEIPRGGVPPLSARQRLPPGSAGGAGYRDRHAGHGGAPPMSARGDGPEWEVRGTGSAGGGGEVALNSSRPPRQIVQEVLRALGTHRVAYRQVSNFLVRCQASGVRFEAEVLQVSRGGGYTLRFSRVSGDVWHYKDMCAQLFSEMQL
eukprot:TRINITY_DN10183_c0_g1_i1.p1 TRINITY_DN10183_c0_g1~~TRINITY_DN10183_c0_g1_i1.p1  ORF type:complete len:707 (+),score=150.33 TRINITY_DN10183_c0_g1_i1:129-2249(+)